jgi:hypothetical protein
VLIPFKLWEEHGLTYPFVGRVNQVRVSQKRGAAVPKIGS